MTVVYKRILDAFMAAERAATKYNVQHSFIFVMKAGVRIPGYFVLTPSGRELRFYYKE